MHCRNRIAFVIVAFVAAWPTAAVAQFATSVVQANLGPGANPSFPPANALGGPQGGGLGAGSLHIAQLGVGGSIVLGFGVTLQDGPGADFTCSENGLMAGGSVFAEVMTVAVSTDGVTFAAFPAVYVGPPAQQPAFGTLPVGTFAGLCGGLPVVANVASNAVSPFDPVVSGGESFDLADLAADPAVVSGAVQLDAIHFVRLTDVPEGTVADANGNLIWDNGGVGGSADLDAVAVISHPGTVTASQPTCDLRFDASGFVELELGDPNGIHNLDLATLSASLDLQRVDFLTLLGAGLFRIVSFDGSTVLLRTVVPIQGLGELAAFAVSVKDKQGNFSGDQLMIQG